MATPTAELLAWATPAQLLAASEWLRTQHLELIMEISERACLDELQQDALTGKEIPFEQPTPLSALQQLQILSSCYELGWQPVRDSAAIAGAHAPLEIELSMYEMQKNPYAIGLLERKIAEEIGRKLLKAGLIKIQLDPGSFIAQDSVVRLIYQLDLP
jgi:hypothetical protein